MRRTQTLEGLRKAFDSELLSGFSSWCLGFLVARNYLICTFENIQPDPPEVIHA
jgi:hypothetical protein